MCTLAVLQDGYGDGTPDPEDKEGDKTTIPLSEYYDAKLAVFNCEWGLAMLW